ncbi:MAG: HAD family phosphatase [Clostridia bacterium]|nr:HAD family phosphatase [Clostridia bacterium]
MKTLLGLQKPIRAAIFDADGTLVDSMPMWNRITYDYADFKGIYAPPGLSKVMNAMCLEQCAAYYKEKLGAEGTVEEIIAEIVEMSAEKYRTSIPEIENASAFLCMLKRENIRTALATASTLSTLTPALSRLGMIENLDVLESCTTIGKSKEHPDIYLKCALDLGVSPGECVVFEDALYAVRTAKNAGFPVVGLLTASLSVEEEAEFRRICDLCIPNYTAFVSDAQAADTSVTF